MGNLGQYQDIVIEAKRVGGIDALIKIIEDTAVGKRSPTILAKGVGVGILLTCLVGGGAVAATRRFVDKRAERESLANEAAKQLKAEIEGPANVDGVSSDNGEDGSDTSGGTYA